MATTKAKATTQPRLAVAYDQEIRDQLKKDLKLGNVHQVPKLEKIVVSVGTGRSKEDKRAQEAVENTLRKITGQQPVPTIARKSIAGFKLREGQKVGYKVTVRGERMYELFDRLVTVVIPRLRDFHGVPLTFDQGANYNLGLTEQSVFPELSFEDTNVLHGLQFTFVTTTNNSDHAVALLKALGMPFEKNKGDA